MRAVCVLCVHRDRATTNKGSVGECYLRELSLRWFTGLTEILTPYFGSASSEVMTMCLDGAGIHTALTGTPPTSTRLEAVIRALATLPDDDASNSDLTDEGPTP